MSLEQISLVAPIVSALAVTASLIFVGIQVRLATKAVRNSSSQAHSAIYAQIVSNVIGRAEFASIWRRTLIDPSGVDEDGWVRFVAYTSALFRFYETSRVQWLHGLLDKEHWQTIEEQIRSAAAQPGVQAWWAERSHWHSAAFRSWFEGLESGDGRPMYSPEVGSEASKTRARRGSGDRTAKE